MKVQIKVKSAHIGSLFNTLSIKLTSMTKVSLPHHITYNCSAQSSLGR